MKKIVIFTLLVFLSACQRAEPELAFAGLTMGTSYHVTIKDETIQHEAQQLQDEIQQRLDEINALMSNWVESSEISRFNKIPVNTWFNISSKTRYVIELALSISQQTDGAFDVTVSPLIETWGFGVNDQVDHIPSQQEINSALKRTGYQHLEINRESGEIRKTKPVTINLSAIAKGYAVDAIFEYLVEKGYKQFLVEIGGEVRAKGKKPDGTNWRIAIEKPDTYDRAVQSVLNLEDAAVATSGDYRNYFEKDGKRYSHTIDPRTGKPVTHDLSSVSVISKTAARADAIATALMVMGPGKGIAFCKQHDINAYFIIKQQDEFRVEMTGEFQDYLNE